MSELLRKGGYYVHGIGAALVLSGAAALVVATSSESPPAHGRIEAPAGSSTDAVLATAPAQASIDDGTASAIPIVTPEALPSAPAADTHGGPRIAPTKQGRHAVEGETPPPAAHASTLALEIAQVEATRAALAAGDAKKTLALLDQYDREFPAGAFAVEVSVLRIEALTRAERTDEARRLGSRFLAEHRQGAFARRVSIALDNANARSPAASASASGNE
ncbi:MAG: hypothetical protein KF764_18970 [Labilithrix sp.]|nr:hypothetical protein [Labilithrix sp.]